MRRFGAGAEKNKMTIDKQLVKDYLEISAATYDTLITNLITRVCAFIESYCDRTFTNATYTDEIYSGGKKFIFLKNYPVTEFTKIEYKSGSNSSPTWTAFTVNDYDLIDERKLRRAGGFAPGENAVWPAGVNNIRITYKAGYAVVPSDLEQLIIELVAKKFNQRKSDGINNESVEGVSIGWTKTLSPEQKIVLNKFRKITV